jgi:hypothetical protein
MSTSITPICGAGVSAQWGDPGLIINKPTKPLDINPFNITNKQVKSHLRHLEGLKEPSFYNDEGK